MPSVIAGLLFVPYYYLLRFAGAVPRPHKHERVHLEATGSESGTPCIAREVAADLADIHDQLGTSGLVYLMDVRLWMLGSFVLSTWATAERDLFVVGHLPLSRTFSGTSGPEWWVKACTYFERPEHGRDAPMLIHRRLRDTEDSVQRIPSAEFPGNAGHIDTDEVVWALNVPSSVTIAELIDAQRTSVRHAA